MKMIVAAVLILASGLPATADAQTLTPAPVPNRELGGVAPSERAGRPDGSERSAPFSGLPSSVGAGAGQDTPSTTGSPRTDTSPTPSLSR